MRVNNIAYKSITIIDFYIKFAECAHTLRVHWHLLRSDVVNGLTHHWCPPPPRTFHIRSGASSATRVSSSLTGGR